MNELCTLKMLADMARDDALYVREFFGQSNDKYEMRCIFFQTLYHFYKMKHKPRKAPFTKKLRYVFKKIWIRKYISQQILDLFGKHF